MVDHPRRQLKAAIKCHSTKKWIKAIPSVFLEVVCAWCVNMETFFRRINLQGTAATGRRIPDGDTTNATTPTGSMQNLYWHLYDLQPHFPNRHGEKRTFVFHNLTMAKYTVVRFLVINVRTFPSLLTSARNPNQWWCSARKQHTWSTTTTNSATECTSGCLTTDQRPNLHENDNR